jgi:hypothetical protein
LANLETHKIYANAGRVNVENPVFSPCGGVAERRTSAANFSPRFIMLRLNFSPRFIRLRFAFMASWFVGGSGGGVVEIASVATC